MAYTYNVSHHYGEMDMKKHFLVACAFVLTLIPALVSAQTYTKNNGIISYDANMYDIPMVSRLRILGTQVMPYDNAGAGLQMTGRSAAGNAYNPTQAGDCTQSPPIVIGIFNNWTGAGIGVPASNSLLFSVAPRNYNEPEWTCSGPGPVLPYEFQFGATLGDGVVIPRQVMVLDMTYTRWDGSEPLDKAQSEAPALFPHLNIFPFAYWSVNGTSFQSLNVNVNGALTNDMRRWPTGINYSRTGHIAMACTATNSNCIALYSHRPTYLVMSRRNGAQGTLSYMTLVADTSGTISDFNPYHVRRLMLAGTPSTVLAAIQISNSAIDYWGSP